MRRRGGPQQGFGTLPKQDFDSYYRFRSDSLPSPCSPSRRGVVPIETSPSYHNNTWNQIPPNPYPSSDNGGTTSSNLNDTYRSYHSHSVFQQSSTVPRNFGGTSNGEQQGNVDGTSSLQGKPPSGVVVPQQPTRQQLAPPVRKRGFSFGKGFFKLRSSKWANSAPNLGEQSAASDLCACLVVIITTTIITTRYSVIFRGIWVNGFSCHVFLIRNCSC